MKKSILDFWQLEDEAFWIHGKIVFNGNENLHRSRFLWSDLDEPLAKIKARFGAQQKIFLMTDRTDRPPQKNLHIIEWSAIRDLVIDGPFVAICAYESDSNLIPAIREIKDRPNSFYFCPFRYVPTARYFHRDKIAHKILQQELRLNLGKFDLGDFENIFQSINSTRGVDGVYVEIGVYRGDSAHAALMYMKEAGITRKSYFFDLFEGFTNPSSALSTDAAWLESHQETSLNLVQELLADFPHATVTKLDIIAEELPDEIIKIALCNIDVDIYEAVKAALEKVAPLMTTGGIIILEDQGHTPYLAGAYLATVEFTSTTSGFVPIHMTSGQMLLVKY
ncbi:MAG: TylF/MycF/NovP-related O-methyltransferase [Chryseolinea sp.]